MRISAYDSEAHTWHWPHAETFDDTDVAVAAADKHNVAQDRLIRGLQGGERCARYRGGMWQHARFRTHRLPPVKLYSMLSNRFPLSRLQTSGATPDVLAAPRHLPRAGRAWRHWPLICLTILAGGCGGFNPASLWPFGAGVQGREPGPPPNATAYRCDGNRWFYLRMLDNGAAWVILPEREFRLDKTVGATGRFGNGVATLDINGEVATLNDGPGQSYTACRVPGKEAAKS